MLSRGWGSRLNYCKVQQCHLAHKQPHNKCPLWDKLVLGRMCLYTVIKFKYNSHAFTSCCVFDITLERHALWNVINWVIFPFIFLQNLVYRPEDTAQVSHDGHKSSTPKTNRKGEGDKEKGKAAATSKSSSRVATVMHHYSTITRNNKAPLNEYAFLFQNMRQLYWISNNNWGFKRSHSVCSAHGTVGFLI